MSEDLIERLRDGDDLRPRMEAATLLERQAKLLEDAREALRRVMNYREGKGEFNFSRLSADDRGNAAFDAWQDVEAEVRSTLKEIEALPA